ncbi:M20 family peptidase [Vibrio europaeus]|uniref:M20 family peptidase n=1 Tax=Vibrio europaeus TaxID=300876 RepID=UPI00233E811F|nr:M20 family peptidase [Vibrio europaeus]MDC5870482.1 M20 family peptidase [Vibrio europaeus]
MTLRSFVSLVSLALLALVFTLLIRTWLHQKALPNQPHIEQKPANAAQLTRLSQAIQFPTVSRLDGRDPNATRVDPAVFLDFHRWLAGTYPLVHRDLELERINQFSLLYRWPGSDPKARPIVLTAHQDIVPYAISTRKTWIHPPYSGAIKDGYVWGRGTMDDKASMLAILESIEALLLSGAKPQRDIYLAFGHDEEVGGEHGAKAMAERLARLGVNPALVLDEGGFVLDEVVPGVPVPVALIGVAEKGYLNVSLTAKGIPGHSSMPPAQTTPGRLARAISRLEDHPMPAEYSGATQQLFDATSGYMAFNYRLLFANLWLFKPLLLDQLTASAATNAVVRTTMAVTLLNAGVKDNVLAPEATANINVRLLPNTEPKQVIEYIEAIIDDPAIQVDIRPPYNRATPISEQNNRAFKILKHTTEKVFGASRTVVAPYLTINATDARHYIELTSRVYRFLPLALDDSDLPRIHGPNERISVEAYGQMLTFYRSLVQQLAMPNLN